ncbi:hypothetical protein GCM10022221_45670 [Actinocorallia aurea]
MLSWEAAVVFMDDAVTRAVGGPERLFGVEVDGDAEGGQSGSMASGAWMARPGEPAAAALAVLMDDTLGRAAAERRPEGSWAVTTELSADYTGVPPGDGRRITSRGSVVSADERGALARGVIEDGEGRALALMTLRSRFLLGMVMRPGGANGVVAGEAPERVSMAAMLGLADRIAEPGPGQRGREELANSSAPSGLVLCGREELANGSGAMHGGVVLCAAQLAAGRLLPGGEGFFLASARIGYLRRLEACDDLELTTRLVHGGRTFRIVEVTVRGPGGRVGAVATVTGYTADH